MGLEVTIKANVSIITLLLQGGGLDYILPPPQIPEDHKQMKVDLRVQGPIQAFR